MRRPIRQAIVIVFATLATLAALAIPAIRAGAACAQGNDLDPSEVLRLGDEAASLGTGADDKHAAIDLGRRAARAAAPSSAILAAPGYDVVHYRLDVTPQRNVRSILGTVTISLVVTDPGLATIALDARVTIDAVSVAGTARTGWTLSAGTLTIPICEGVNCPPHAPGDALDVVVQYHASPTLGYYNYARNGYTFVEPSDAPYWWVCHDDPSDKATLDVYATVPDTNVCFSNGVNLTISPPVAGKWTWHWSETHPIATYLVSIALGKYWQLPQSASGIPIQNAVFPEDSTKAKFDYANVPAMVAAYAARWGPYPFDKYGQVTVDPFGPGGMEHQTMTTLRRSLLRGDRTYEFVWAHELAHQWWGDWVTLSSFANIWLNEGFASYGEVEWQEDFYGPAAHDVAIQDQMNSALTADLNFRYAVYDPPVNYLFGSTIYKKGSLVLHMLRRVLGDGAFFAGLELYGQRFGSANATSADFQKAMEDASGQALDWYFQPWLYGQGLPTYQWSWWTAPLSAGASQLGIGIRQVQSNSPLYRMPIELRVTRAGGMPDTTVVVWNEAQADQQFIVPMAGVPNGVTFDPRNSILKRTQEVIGAPDPGALADVTGPRLALHVAPNPTRSTVTLTIARAAGVAPGEPVRIRVYDSSGRFLRDLSARARAASGTDESNVRWDLRGRDGSRVPAGLYFVSATVGPFRDSRPVVVVE